MKNKISHQTEEFNTAYYESPIGTLEISSGEKGITSVLFLNSNSNNNSQVDSLLENCIHQLDEYFHHKRQIFDFPLMPRGTAFQRQVWEKLLEIPCGKTCSYHDIAKRLGNPKAIRAVGGANGKNPIAIIIPCHRVIGASGKLIGYGGGLWRKEWLLRHEQNIII